MREKTLFQLGKRLGLCAAMVRPGCRLADIGTDHGYLPVWLAKTGAILSAVAADVREGPLQSARQNIERYGVQDQVTARLSDGLDLVSAQEADDIVIAGMGGELIARLVDRAAWLRDPQKHLILQPMSSAEDLRAFLLEKGFGVFREEAVQEDNHLYSVMLVWYDPEQAARCGRDPSFLHHPGICNAEGGACRRQPPLCIARWISNSCPRWPGGRRQHRISHWAVRWRTGRIRPCWPPAPRCPPRRSRRAALP